MTREQIEKAAMFSCTSKDEVLTDFGRNCFIEGAQWRINAVWHDAKEVPQREDEYLLIEYRDWGSDESDYDVIAVENFEIYADRPYSDLIRWAYISDLIPERKEETK